MVRDFIIGALLLLTGCGQPTSAPTANIIQSEEAAQVAAMPEGQRNAVFIRAIRDAGQACQRVHASAPIKGAVGAWAARCADGRHWSVTIGADGIAQVAQVRPGGQGGS